MAIVLQILLVVWVFRLLTNVFRLCATKFYFYLFKNNYKHLNRCSRPVGVLFSKANTQQYKERQSFFDLLQQIQVFPSFFTSFQQSPFNGTVIVVLLIVLQISFANVIIEQRS